MNRAFFTFARATLVSPDGGASLSDGVDFADAIDFIGFVASNSRVFHRVRKAF